MSGREAPLISVIIPAYDTERYIHQAVSSVLQQTLTALEVVVVDDCSTDDTARVLSTIGDARVRLFINKSNLGPSGSRNRAIEEARGEWIAVLDSDDWYAPQRLQRLLGVARERGSDIVADDVFQIDDGAPAPWSTQLRLGGRQRHVATEVDADAFLASNMPGLRRSRLGGMRPLIRRKFLSANGLRYQEGLSYTEDFDLYFRCLLAGARFTIVPEAYYYRRNRAGGLAGRANRMRNLAQSMRANRELLDHPQVRNLPGLTRLLRERERLIVQGLELENVRQSLGRREWAKVVASLMRRPRTVVGFLRRLPLLIQLRWTRRFGHV